MDKTEVNLKRLFRKCDELLETKPNEDELKASMKAVSKTERELLEYKSKIEFLEDSISDSKLLNASSQSGMDKEAKMLFQQRKAEKQDQQKKELLSSTKVAAGCDDRLKSLMSKLDSQIRQSKPAQPSRLSFDSTAEKENSEAPKKRNIDVHRELHEEYSAEMLHFVSIMKANSKNMNDILKQDSKSADDLHHVMSNAHGRLVSNNDSLNSFSRRSKKTTWLMWFILILVIFMFIATFLFMKVFSKKNPQ